MTSSEHPARTNNASSCSSLESEPDKCAICWDTIHGVSKGTCILKCGHEYHLSCIGSAFNTKRRMECPSCRNIEEAEWLCPNSLQLIFDDDDDDDDFFGLDSRIHTLDNFIHHLNGVSSSSQQRAHSVVAHLPVTNRYGEQPRSRAGTFGLLPEYDSTSDEVRARQRWIQQTSQNSMNERHAGESSPGTSTVSGASTSHYSFSLIEDVTRRLRGTQGSSQNSINESHGRATLPGTSTSPSAVSARLDVTLDELSGRQLWTQGASRNSMNQRERRPIHPRHNDNNRLLHSLARDDALIHQDGNRYTHTHQSNSRYRAYECDREFHRRSTSRHHNRGEHRNTSHNHRGPFYERTLPVNQDRGPLVGQSTRSSDRAEDSTRSSHGGATLPGTSTSIGASASQSVFSAVLDSPLDELIGRQRWTQGTSRNSMNERRARRRPIHPRNNNNIRPVHSFACDDALIHQNDSRYARIHQNDSRFRGYESDREFHTNSGSRPIRSVSSREHGESPHLFWDRYREGRRNASHHRRGSFYDRRQLVIQDRGPLVEQSTQPSQHAENFTHSSHGGADLPGTSTSVDHRLPRMTDTMNTRFSRGNHYPRGQVWRRRRG